MATWVLIFWLFGYAGGPSAGTAEFSSRETCEAALKQLKEVRNARNSFGFCTAK